MSTYSFQDTQATIDGPGGSFSFGSDSGAADEGISVEREGDTGSLTMGAGGQGMHNLFMAKNGTVTIRLLKTSPLNAMLMTMYNQQRASAADWGRNTISVTHSISGDKHTCAECAFVKPPNMAYAKEGGTNEWQFRSAAIDSLLGDY